MDNGKKIFCLRFLPVASAMNLEAVSLGSFSNSASFFTIVMSQTSPNYKVWLRAVRLPPKVYLRTDLEYLI